MSAGNLEQVRRLLVDEIGLEIQEAELYLLVTVEGRMSAEQVSRSLGISVERCNQICDRLVYLGALISMPRWFEATHPRFAAVSMYRRIRIDLGEQPGRSKAADGVGASLEDIYDTARAKYVRGGGYS